MPFNNYGQIEAAYQNGQYFTSVFRKEILSVAGNGVWVDFSMFPGLPSTNWYSSTPKTSTSLFSDMGSGGLGIEHGGPTGSQYKHLIRSLVTYSNGSSPLIFHLCDCLMYYSSCDMSLVAPQYMSNTTSLPRYTTGEGVQIMAVTSLGMGLGSQSFTVGYTNSQGVSGRVTQQIVCNTSTIFNGTAYGLICTGTSTAGPSGFGSPWLPLQKGDTGVESIQWFDMLNPDTGGIVLVLVKPLTTFQYLTGGGVSPACEVNYLKDYPSLPRIYDGAFLNLITMASSSMTFQVALGELEFIWN